MAKNLRQIKTFRTTPHPIPYFGSKRRMAEHYGKFIRYPTDTFYEPFAGSLAMTLWAANNNLAKYYVVGDLHGPLIELWKCIVSNPDEAAAAYRSKWTAGLGNRKEVFHHTTDIFNASGDPLELLYLIPSSFHTCPRFDAKGNYTASPQTHREPTSPDRMQKNIEGASYLLRNRTTFYHADWEETVESATKKDFVFLDPPYQQKTGAYLIKNKHTLFIDGVSKLLKRHIPMMITYDGAENGTLYKQLPKQDSLTRFFMAKPASKRVVAGKRGTAFMESIYIHPPQKKWTDQIIEI